MNFLEAKWENLIMANYAIDPTILIPYLPKGVELDIFEGKCYVSLVGFMFNKTKIFRVPIPYLGSFEEINLRFYVVRKDGDTLKRGVVFINETVPYAAVAPVDMHRHCACSNIRIPSPHPRRRSCDRFHHAISSDGWQCQVQITQLGK